MTPDERMQPVLAVVDSYVLHHDDPERGGIDALAAVRDAIVALVVGELEACRPSLTTTHYAAGKMLGLRLAEWQAAREG